MGLPNICVTVTPIIGTDVVGFETDFMGTVTRQVACLQDKAVHDRLVALGWTPPASAAPKDHQIAALVNKVRDIARMFHDHQSLRERIAIELVPALKASQEVKSNAERWRYAIDDGGNQSMNFIDIFDDWNGDGSFVEAFDKARLADKKEGSAA